jgi:Fur family peroxide stress response transcriptional regulator
MAETHSIFTGRQPIMTHERTQQRIADFPTTCRGAGLKVTPQRMAIFGMLAATDSHPSPEEVYSEIRKATPSISLATVYKILELFHHQGFIRRVSTLDQVTRYDANVEPHHHLICSHCGKIQDIDVEAISGRPPAKPELPDFQVSDYEIQFHGTCSECRPRA